MKREIKFKAKAINDGYYKGEWVYGYYTKILQGGELVDVMTDGAHEVPIQIDTLGQYTGLKDMDGKEIYEDDIIDEKGYLRVVVFEDHMWCIQNNVIEPKDNPQRWYIDDASIYVVVGNIHDTPNWVKGGEQ